MALAAIPLLIQPTTAEADVEATISVVEPGEWQRDSSTRATLPPRFRAEVLDAPVGLEATDFRLTDEDQPRVSIAATSAKPYAEAGQPMALVVLVQGEKRWIEHAWDGLGPALTALSRSGPEGSVASVLAYHSAVEVLHPTGPLAELDGNALGDLASFRTNAGHALLAGLTEAIARLSEQENKRRVLVVIGDGTARRGSISKDLRKAIDELKRNGIEIYTLTYEAVPTDSPVGVQNMVKLGYHLSRIADAPGDIVNGASDVVAKIGARYYVTFEGLDAETRTYFAHDGEEREYTLEVGDELIEEIPVRTLAWAPPGKHAESEVPSDTPIREPASEKSSGGCTCRSDGAGGTIPTTILIGLAFVIAIRRWWRAPTSNHRIG